MDQVLLRMRDAAELAGCSKATAYNMVARGEWPSVQTPYGKRIPREKLLEWMEKLEITEGRKV